MKTISTVFKLAILIAFLFPNSSFAQGGDCTNATFLPNTANFCSGNGFYTNSGSILSGFATATCWPVGATEDVWFTFIASGTDVTINISGAGSAGGTINSPQVALYSGNCLTTINELACASGPAATDLASLYKGALTIGTTYYIRVSSNNANEGTFELCINNYTPPASVSADCSGAGFLCNNSPVSNISLSGGGTNQNEPLGSCLDDGFSTIEANSAWYTWTCGTSGTLTFDLTPFNATDDIDFVLYQLSTTNACGPRVEIRCSAASCLNATGSTGLNGTSVDVSELAGCAFPNDAYVSAVNMTAGTSYVLCVNNWSTAGGFNINFGGTGTFAGPVANFTTSSFNPCVGQAVTYNGSASAGYTSLTWTFPGGSPASATGVGPHIVTYTTPGVTTAILQAFSGACPPDVMTQTLTVVASPTATIAAANTIMCNPNSVTLSGSGGGTYNWAGPGIVSGGATASPVVNAAGVYTMSVTVAGCTSTNTVNVTSNTTPPNANSSTANGTILTCSLTTLPLLGSSTTPNATFSWTGPSGALAGNPASATATGTYTVTVTDPVNGCTNTSTQVITSNLTPPDNSFTTPQGTALTCATTTLSLQGNSTTPGASQTWIGSGGPLVGNPATATTSGTYTLVVVDPTNGCASSNTVTVTNSGAIPNITASANTTTLTCTTGTVTLTGSTTTPNTTSGWTDAGGPITGNPFSTSTAGSYTYTVTDNGTGCSTTQVVTITSNSVAPTATATPTSGTLTCATTTVSLTGSSNVIGATYSWTGSSGSIPGNPATISVADVYTVTVTDPANGCSSTTTATVTASSQLPNISATSPSTVVTCASGALVLTGNSTTPGVTYSWNGPSGSMPGNPVNASAAGTYTLTVTDPSTGCSDNQTITLSTNTIPPDANAGTGQVLTCTSTSAILTGSSTTPGATFVWTGPGGFSSSTSTATVTATGQYTLTVTDPTNGCTAMAPISVSSNGSLPIANTGASPILPCVGSTSLTGSSTTPGATYAWSGPGGFTSTSPTPTVNVVGTYTLVVTDPASGCSTAAFSTVSTTTVVPNANAGAPQTLPCIGSATLSGSSTNPGATYVWAGPGIVSNGTTANPSVNVAGTYTVTVTDPFTGCTNTATVSVNNGTNPVAVASASPTSGVAPATINFYSTGSQNATGFTWVIFDNPIQTTSLTNTNHLFNTAGTYTVMLVADNGNGCYDTTYLSVLIDEPFSIVVPNVFSPNSDNLNDAFMINASGLKEMECTIFNRWGTKITTFGLNGSWDGKANNGDKASEGTYYYMLKATGVDGTEHEFKGWITLVL